MNISELIKTLVDYLDLGKRIATTIPGMVLAFGFVLLFAQPPDSMQKHALEQLVESQQKLVQNSQALLRNAEEEKREVTDQISTIQQLQNAVDSVLQAKLAVYKNGPTDKNLEEIRTLGQQKSDLGKNLPQLRKRQDELSNDGQNLTKLITSQQAQLDAYRQRAAFGSEFDQALSKAFSSLLLFGLFGFAIGTVLDPVNKALFLQLVPQLGAAASRGSKRFKALRALSGRHFLEVEHPGAVDLSIRSAHYYIGRGLITAAEYDGVEADYYRFSEISIGMIIPTLVLAAGFAHVFSTRLGGFRYALYPASVAIAYFLYLVGVKRYGEFNRHLTDLIAGKEQAIRDQEARLAKTSVLVELTQVVAQLKQVLHEQGKHIRGERHGEKNQ